MLWLKNLRVFIIEDNLVNRSIMQTLLEQQGAVVGFERWGLDFEARLLKFMPVDVILLDLMFPDNVSGYDIFDRLHQQPQFANIPIVAVSALDATAQTRARGFAGFIKKPINMDTFARQIASIADGKPVWVYNH